MMESGPASSKSTNERSALLGDFRDTLERGEGTNAQTPPSSHGGRNSKWARVKYYLPVIDWLPNYSISYLGSDFLAGLTIASLLIPQSISYGTSLAKLSPMAGLFSAAIPGVVYAMLGTSRQLNVAPEAALSLILGQAIDEALHRNKHEHVDNPNLVRVAVATITMFQVGVFAFLLGFFRLGFIDVLLSRALQRGFVTAIAVVISIEQFIPMLGLINLEHKLKPHTTVDKFLFLVQNTFEHMHMPTAVISFGALAILILLRSAKTAFPKYRLIYRLPEVLLVVIASTFLSDILNWESLGVGILGDVPITSADSHLVRFPIHHSTLKYLRSTTSTAVLITVVGYLDSIVSAKQNATRFGYSVSPNRELVALGAANIVGSFFPGILPAFGSITRSRLNAEVGAKSQMSALIASAIILLATFFLLPTLYYLPRCVLASIVFMVVFSLLADAPHDVRYYWRMRAWTDLGLMAITFFASLLWSVETGIVCSFICSLLMVLHRSSRPRITILGQIPGTSQWKPIKDNPLATDIPGALIIRLRDNLDFANTAQLKERLRRLELYGLHPSHPSEAPLRELASVIVFHLADVEACDASAAQIFYELLENYKTRGVTVLIAHLRAGPRISFERARIVKLLGENAFFEDVATAMLHVERTQTVSLRR